MVDARDERAPDIVAVGSVAYDDVVSPAGARADQLGGSTVFFSLAARLFAKVGIVAAVGADFEQSDKRLLSERGIDLRWLQQRDGKTFRWRGSYVDDLNNAVTLDTQLNVFEDFKPDLGAAHADARALFLGNIAPAIQLDALRSLTKRPRWVVCDTMNLWIETRRDELTKVFEQVDVITINEAEARAYTGADSPAGAAAELLRRGPRYALIKRGEYGAMLFGRDFAFAAPAYPLTEVRDPTGAGDSFAGGFVGVLASRDAVGERELKQATIIGSAIASFTVSDFGTARLADLNKAELAKRCAEFKRLTRFDDIAF